MKRIIKAAAYETTLDFAKDYAKFTMVVNVVLMVVWLVIKQ